MYVCMFRTKATLLAKLATVIGLKKNNIRDIKDPDPSYVITVDNVMKMMAILMRFRYEVEQGNFFFMFIFPDVVYQL